MADTALTRAAPRPPRPAPRGRPAPPGRRRALRLARTIGAPLLLAALVTAGSPGWGLYTIKQGDTLSDIAARYHTTVAKLVEVNRLPGQRQPDHRRQRR